MNWGAGSGLGPLTVFAYLLFLAGAALMWRSRGDFIVEPHGEITATAPHERGASQEQQISENGQGPEPRACSPIHKSSQAPHTVCLVRRPELPEGYSPSWMVTRRTTSNSFFPAGVATSISSPTLRLRSALPIGEVVEIRPFSASASSVLTRV